MNSWSWIDHLLPRSCLLCGDPAATARNLCDGCHDDLPFLSTTGCVQCARPLARTAVCGQCQQHPPAFTTTIAALHYEGCCAALVHRFKFGADQAAGCILATVLAARTRHAARPDFLVPIPLSRRRLRSRGFDQSWELTRQIAKMAGFSTKLSAVRRISNHIPQSSLQSWSARRRNVRGVFHVEPALVRNKHIAIVDDVMTSGATANSLADQLIHSGAHRVDVWVVCRAGLLSGIRSSIKVSD